jgi:5-(carboxyamino)imidazole ribonucleotide mutase
MVSIIMGSASDMPIMEQASDILQKLGIPFELDIVSAHRTPEKMFSYAKAARGRGVKVVVAGAGGAAHLPGMVASLTSLPVVGVPIKSTNSIDGWDSMLSILQMPNGIPVATVAVNAGMNGGLMAARILGATDQVIASKLDQYQADLAQKVLQASALLNPKNEL